MTSDDVFVQITPCRNRCLALSEGDCEQWSICLLRLDIDYNRENYQSSQESHSSLCHSQQKRPVLTELNSLDSGWEVPSLERLSGLHIPDFDSVVCGPGGKKCTCRVDINSPESSLVPVVGTEALTVDGVPCADNVVLCGGEEKIAYGKLALRYLWVRSQLTVFVVPICAEKSQS